MGTAERFYAYALAFEETYDDDDWTRIAPFFADDAVYEVRNSALACRIEGRDAILRGLKKSLDGFDRKLGKRALDVVSGPDVDGESIRIGWTATYQVAGAPPFVLRGQSTARLRDGGIVELIDEYPDGMDAEIGAWVAAHAPDVSPSYV
jgi:hypothetical protein